MEYALQNGKYRQGHPGPADSANKSLVAARGRAGGGYFTVIPSVPESPGQSRI